MNRQTFSLNAFGTVLFTPLALLWQLLNQVLLSPWGLIVPLTLLIALFAVQQIQKTPAQLALYYAERFETCTEAELPPLLEVLLRMEDAGVPGLVKGLTSNREMVFTACRNVLQHEFDRWQESDRREHHFRVFAEALLQTCPQFSHAGQVEAMRFIEQLMQIRSTATTSPEAAVERQKMIAHCERLLSQLDSVRRRRTDSQATASAPNTVAALNQRTQQPVLLASNGQPFVPTSARNTNSEEVLLADANSYNQFSVTRADRLAAYQRATQNQRAPSVAEQNMEVSPSIASFTPPLEATADVVERFAQNFSANELEQTPPPNISEKYRNQKLLESGGIFNADTFLSPELQNTPLDRVPQLPTTQLMQMLHHPEPSYIESARRTLTSREGFQEPHLKLAWRLYHPIPTARQEIVAILPHTSNVRPSDWLEVLLNDPSSDVRYRAASYLATTSDPALRRLLIDRGKRDSDERIVNLADRLDESQRTTVRR